MKIICVGRNYINHAKELNNTVPSEPVLFLKPDSAVMLRNAPFVIPAFSNNVHYEIEVVIKIKKLGKYIDEKFAHTYYDEIGLGIDFTARDVQQDLKEKGLPWEKAKAFDGSAFISDFIDKKSINNINELNFSLEQNSSIVQNGNTKNMIWKIDELIAHISQYFTLKIGDIIFTGTPAGVGAVNEKDILTGYIENQKIFSINVR